MTEKRGSGKARILGVHSGALGDCILFARLLERLDGQTTLLAGGSKGRLLAGLGAVDSFLDFDALPMHEVFSDNAPADCDLPRYLGGFDRLVSCFAAGDRHAELRLAAMCQAAAAAFLPIRPPVEATCHLVELWGDMLGRSAPSEYRAWTVPPAWRRQAGEALRGAGVDASQPYLAIHPGAGADEKCWPLERFIELGDAGDLPAVFVLGPVEADRWRAEKIARLAAARPVLICPELEILAGVLGGAAAYVGNDSGASHLAAAVGAATVVLFGPTRAAHFAPLGERVVTVCRPALRQITVARVRDALRSGLA